MKDNWYRKARLIDKDPDIGKQTYVQCFQCKKFLTSPSGETTDPKSIWKDRRDMDPIERDEHDAAMSMFEADDYSAPIGITSVFCPLCFAEQQEEVNRFFENKNKNKSKLPA